LPGKTSSAKPRTPPARGLSQPRQRSWDWYHQPTDGRDSAAEMMGTIMLLPSTPGTVPREMCGGNFPHSGLPVRWTRPHLTFRQPMDWAVPISLLCWWLVWVRTRVFHHAAADQPPLGPAPRARRHGHQVAGGTPIGHHAPSTGRQSHAPGAKTRLDGGGACLAHACWRASRAGLGLARRPGRPWPSMRRHRPQKLTGGPSPLAELLWSGPPPRRSCRRACACGRRSS